MYAVLGVVAATSAIVVHVLLADDPMEAKPELTIVAQIEEAHIVVDLGKQCFLMDITKDPRLLSNKEIIFDATISINQAKVRGCAIIDTNDDNILFAWEDGTANALPLSSFDWTGDKSRVIPRGDTFKTPDGQRPNVIEV
jgi:hypothetical protein